MLTEQALNTSILLLKHLRFDVTYHQHQGSHADPSRDPGLDQLAFMIDNHDARTADLKSITFQLAHADIVDPRLDGFSLKERRKAFTGL